VKSVALQAVVALALFGCLPVTIKAISADPDTIGIVRLAIASVGLFLINWMRGELRRVSRPDLLRIAVLGFFFFAHWLTFFVAIKTSSASVGAIGLSTYGIDLLILGAMFGGSRLRLVDVIAVAVAATGAILVVPRFDIRNETAFGMLLACISGLFYAALPILHQRWSHISTSTRALGQFSFALVFFLFFLPRTNWNLSSGDWAGLLFLAIGVTLIGHSLWVNVTTKLSPPVTSIIYYGNIPIALLLSVLILDEPLTPRMFAGAVLIIAGGVAGLASRARANRSQQSPPPSIAPI
jgi:drug/metabolite transporter (DMT)-like permease